MACTLDCRAPSISQAHCSACHQTFSGVSYFDMHRTGDVDQRRCLGPQEIVIKNQDGAHRLALWNGVWSTVAGHEASAAKSARFKKDT